MPLASRPRLRASAALALAVYGMVLIAGPALLHDFLCPGHHTAQCVVCAALSTASSAAEPAVVLAHDLSDAGAIVVGGAPSDGANRPSATSDRAPPAGL